MQNNYNKFHMVIALYGKVINKQLDFKGEKYIVILFVTQ